MHKQETFPIFLALALLCLCAPLPSVRRRPAQVATLLLAGAFVFLPARGLASPGPALFRTGVKQLAARNFTGSLEAFRAAAETFPDSERRALAWYNAGLACFGQALSDEPLDPLSSQTYYRQSCACFRAAVEMRPSWPDARWNLELALHRLARISRRANGPPSKEKDASERPEQARPQPDSPATEKEEEGARKTDQDRPSEPSSQLDGQRVMDLNAQDIPPPVVEPEDLFQQERESDEARQKNSAANFRPVERDW